MGNWDWPCSQEANREHEESPCYKPSNLCKVAKTSPEKSYFPNLAIKWWTSIQRHKPRGKFSYCNHKFTQKCKIIVNKTQYLYFRHAHTYIWASNIY